MLGRRSSTSPGTGCCFAPQLCLVLAGGPGQVLAPKWRGCLCCCFGDGIISLASPRGQHTHWTRPSVGRRLVPCSACQQSALGWFFPPAPTALTPFQMNLRPPGQTWGPATQVPVCTADQHNQLPPEMRTCAPLSPSSNPSFSRRCPALLLTLLSCPHPSWPSQVLGWHSSVFCQMRNQNPPHLT